MGPDLPPSRAGPNPMSLSRQWHGLLEPVTRVQMPEALSSAVSAFATFSNGLKHPTLHLGAVCCVMCFPVARRADRDNVRRSIGAALRDFNHVMRFEIPLTFLSDKAQLAAACTTTFRHLYDFSTNSRASKTSRTLWPLST